MDVTETRANTAAAPAEFHLLARQIRSEFDEMPGLSLTLNQAVRFWNLDARTCESLLTTLVEQGFLRRTAGRYFRAS